MNIDEFVQKYKDEDPNWSVEILLTWLVEKKNIPKEIAVASINAVLVENGSNIPSHHGIDGFDNVVLKTARQYMIEANNLTLQVLNKDLEERMKKFLGGSRWSKVWRSLRGKL
jgi:hypothetical protein